MAVSRGPLQGKPYYLSPNTTYTPRAVTPLVTARYGSQEEPTPTVPPANTGGKSPIADAIASSFDSFIRGTGANFNIQSYATQNELRNQVTQALEKVNASPAVSAQRKQQLEEDIARIQSGDIKPTTTLGKIWDKVLPDAIQKPIETGFGTTVEVAADIIGTPLRMVESAAKEVSDLRNVYSDGKWFSPDKDQFSFVDWFNQSTNPNWNPEYKPIQNIGELFNKDWSENGWATGVDKVLNTTVKIGADPVTYVTFGQLRFSGSAGRAALAQEVGTSMRFRAMNPDWIATEMSNAYRFGESGLSTEVRQMLVNEGVLDPAGFRWAGKVVPMTGEAGTRAAGAVAGARAAIGDKLPTLATSFTAKERLGLSTIARGGEQSTEQTLAAFATYEAGKFAQAESGKIVSQIASDNKAIINEANNPSTLKTLTVGNEDSWVMINDYMEGVATSIPQDLKGIADNLRTVYDDALEKINTHIRSLNEGYGTNLPEITRLDNYVHRTLTPQARKSAFRSTKYAGTRSAKVWAQIRRDLSVTANDLYRNEGFTMSRSGAKTFLGEPLRNNSISAYNEIARAKLGFDLFETNSGQIMKSYLDSLGGQLRRQLFVERMLRVHPEGMKVFVAGMEGRTPKALRNAIDELTKTIDELRAGVVKSTPVEKSVRQSVLDEVETVRNSLVAQASPAFKASGDIARRNKILANRLSERAAELRAAEEAAVKAGETALSEYDAVVQPLLRRLDALSAALTADSTAYNNALIWLRQKHEAVFPHMLASERPQTAEGLADAIIGDAGSRLRGAARKNVIDKAEAARVAGASKKREVVVGGVTMRVTEASAEASTIRRTVAAAEKKFKDTIASDPAVKNLSKAEQKFNRTAASFDASSALAGTRQQWENQIGTLYRQDIEDVRNLINDVPKVADGFDPNVEWINKVQDTLNNIQALDVPDAQKDVLDRIFTQLFADEGRLAKIEAMTTDLNIMQDAEARVADWLASGEWFPDLVDGWTAIKNLHVQVSPEVKNSVTQMFEQLDEAFLQQLSKPETYSLAKDIFLTVNSYFKGTALMTVGYSIRNALTATFNNLAMGTTLAQVKDGIAFSASVWHNGLTKALDDVERKWAQKSIEVVGRDGATRTIAGAEAGRFVRQQYEDAFKAVQMSGGQRFLDEAAPVIGRKWNQQQAGWRRTTAMVGESIFRPFGGIVSSKFRIWNEYVELGARMGMAINGVQSGMSIQQAGARIARVQFDYTQLSAADEKIKTFIPFWVFTSRNFPLQIVNQVARPAMYVNYDKLTTMGAEVEGLPYWKARRNPIKLPFGEWYLDLDLPMQSLGETFNKYTDFNSVIGEVTPIARSPIEMAVGARMIQGEPVPYSNAYRPAGITDIFALPFFADTPDPELQGIFGKAVQDKITEPIKGAVPVLGNLEKYIVAAANAATGGNAPREIGGANRVYKKDPLNTLYQALGLGLYRPTEQDKQNEFKARERELQDLLMELQRLGFVEGN